MQLSATCAAAAAAADRGRGATRPKKRIGGKQEKFTRVRMLVGQTIGRII
jgi:hypothetical protein